MAGRDSHVSLNYSHEFRSPPVPLVALIGCPEYHKPISEFFLHSLKPPLVSLCCNEAVEQFVLRAFAAPGYSKRQANIQVQPRAVPGILKADWLIKHRQRRPAVALAIVHRHDMQGDPSAWNRMLYTLKFIRDAVAPRGAGMLVAVVQAAGVGELPSDILTSVSHHLSLDPRCIVPVPLATPVDDTTRAARDTALKNLGLMASEQCAAYYARRAKHVADKHAERQANQPEGRCAPEVNARAAIKLAVYAEFRQDWRAAVSEYQTAYTHVRAIIAPPTPTPTPTTPTTPPTPAHHNPPIHTSQSMPHVPSAAGTPEAMAQAPQPAQGVHMHETGASHGEVARRALQHGQHGHHASWSSVALSSLPTAPGQGLPPHPQQPAQRPAVNTNLSVQRFAQAARVSELLQLKLVILLTYRERLEEAAAQAHAHIQFFMRPPVALPPAAAAAHAGYLVRQLQVTAEVLSPKVEAAPALAAAAKECNRATLLNTAAQIAVDRRRVLDTLAAVRSSHLPIDPSLVVKGPFVGTVALKADTGNRELSDPEFQLWVEHEELRVLGHGTPGSTPSAVVLPPASSSQASVGAQTGLAGSGGTAVEVLNTALQALTAGSPLERQRCHLSLLLAEEYVLLGSLSAARKILLQAAHTFRKEGWYVPLAHALLLLREVSQRFRLPAEHIAYSLELCSVLSALSGRDQQALAQSCAARGLALPAAEPCGAAAVQALTTGVHDSARLPGIIKTGRVVSPEPTPASASVPGPLPRAFHYTVEWCDLSSAALRKGSQTHASTPPPSQPSTPGGRASTGAVDAARHPTAADLIQRHHQQDFGWSEVLGVAVTFPADSALEATSLDLYVSVFNTLPFSLPLAGAEVTLADELASQWTVPLLPEPLSKDLEPFQPGSQASTQLTGASEVSNRATESEAADTDKAATPLSTSPSLSRRASGAHTTLDGVSRALALTHLGQSQNGTPSTPQQPLNSVLQEGIWTGLATRIAPRGVGRLRVEKLTLYLGSHATVSFLVSSFPLSPPGQVSLGGCMERLHGLQAPSMMPFHHLSHLGPLGGSSINIQHVGALPELKLFKHHEGPAYLGEPAFVAAQIQVSQALPSSVLELAVRPLTPGMTAAHISILVDDRGTLERYHGQDMARLQLPSIAAGRSHSARVWVVARHPGRVSLAATLQCPALVTQMLDLEVEDPLHLNVQMTSEPGHHVLVPPPPPLPGSVIPTQPLTIGQQALAHLALCHSATAPDAAEIELTEAQVSSNAASGVTSLADLNEQLSTADGAPLLSLNRGDVALLLAPLLPSALTPGPTPLGHLQVTWRRTHRRGDTRDARTSDPSQPPFTDVPLQQGDGAAGAEAGVQPGGSLASADAPAQQQQLQQTLDEAAPDLGLTLDKDQVHSLAMAQPRPSGKVISRLELPPVMVQEALLSVRTMAPAQATAGISFTYACQVQNYTTAVQEVTVALLDAAGFVLSGERAQQVAVPPRQTGGAMTVTWLLVAHTAGQLTLPCVRVGHPRQNATLTTQPTHIHVLPF